MKKGRRSGAPSRGGEKKKTTKRKTKEKNHKNDMKFMRIFHFLWLWQCRRLSAGTPPPPPQGSNVGDLRGWLGERWEGWNILGNVLYGVLSFSSWFSCSFIYFSSSSFFSVLTWCHLFCSSIYIHTYVYGISIGMCVCKPEAAVKWEWLLFFVFFFQCISCWTETEAIRVHVERPQLMRFHARHRTNLSYLGI